MFFSETLGPTITRRTGDALFEHVQVKLGARSASADELRAIVTEFIVERSMTLKPDAAIQYLAINGMLSQQDGMTFKLAA